jgi:hypothetical protein
MRLELTVVADSKKTLAEALRDLALEFEGYINNNSNGELKHGVLFDYGITMSNELFVVEGEQEGTSWKLVPNDVLNR